VRVVFERGLDSEEGRGERGLEKEGNGILLLSIVEGREVGRDGRRVCNRNRAV
jgi:hypothetical protein